MHQITGVISKSNEVDLMLCAICRAVDEKRESFLPYPEGREYGGKGKEFSWLKEKDVVGAARI